MSSFILRPLRFLGSAVLLSLVGSASAQAQDTAFQVLKAADNAALVERFNSMEDENVTNLISNAESWQWMRERIPLFECSDASVTELWYYRWWALRKHLRKDPSGHLVYTEFLTKNRPVSSALGHHLMEGRWLREQSSYDQYVDYWLHGNKGAPQPHLRKYSSWLPWALWQRARITGDNTGLIALLDDLVAHYAAWEQDHCLPSGLYWQNDVWDAMEESISGSRKERHLRPTINSYMYGNALALAEIATLAGRKDLVDTYTRKAAALKALVQAELWDPKAAFFKVRHQSGVFADVREQLGYIPWYFGLPEKGRGYAAAWAQFSDPQGFRAPFGLATAERRHPLFRSHGVGTCEWDGAVWPFATSQTLTALGVLLRSSEHAPVSSEDYLDAFMAYVRSHQRKGLPYIGEYLDEVNGEWLKGDAERSRYYNHSTFADLVVSDLVGLQAGDDRSFKVHPLISPKAWSWFCLDGVLYRGHLVTIIWDEDGSRYGRGAGLRVIVDGTECAAGSSLAPVCVPIPQGGAGAD